MDADLLRGRRVLVLEDEYLIAMDLCQFLDQEGATVVGPVQSVEDALLVLRDDERLDAAVLDINLHGEAAFPVADLLTARHIPFVFTTGYDRLGVPEAYRSAPRCEKPVRPESVLDALRQALLPPRAA